MRSAKVAFLLAVGLACLPQAAWSIEPVETGRQIVTACQAYLKLPPDAAENARFSHGPIGMAGVARHGAGE